MAEKFASMEFVLLPLNISLISIVYFTHPVTARSTTLSSLRERGLSLTSSHPFCETEKGDQRSVFRVS